MTFKWLINSVVVTFLCVSFVRISHKYSVSYLLFFNEQITSMKAVASISLLCAQIIPDIEMNFALSFMWKFVFDTLSSSSFGSEVRYHLYGLFLLRSFARVIRCLFMENIDFLFLDFFLPLNNISSFIEKYGSFMIKTNNLIVAT